MDFIIKNEKLTELLKKKESVILMGRKQKKQYDILIEDMRKTGMQVQKLKEKIIPLVEAETKALITGEFEEIDLVQLNKKGQIVVKTFDRIEKLKSEFRKQKEERPVEAERPRGGDLADLVGDAQEAKSVETPKGMEDIKE